MAMAKKVTSKNTTPRVQDEAKYEHAFLLFMQGIKQKEICKRVGISEPTMSNWSKDGGWREKRAAKTISRQDLVNKLLQKIADLLDESENDEEVKGLEDKLSKLGAMVEKLDKQANVVDIIDVFMSFNTWLIARQAIDRTINDEALKLINKMQDVFVNERLTSGKR